MQPCIGVKGLSALHILPSFDIVDGVAIDYMHCLLEGIGKKLFSLWFEQPRTAYYIKLHVGLLDERMAQIKPPDSISRAPRKVSSRKHWKGVGKYLRTIHLAMQCEIT